MDAQSNTTENIPVEVQMVLVVQYIYIYKQKEADNGSRRFNAIEGFRKRERRNVCYYYDLPHTMVSRARMAKRSGDTIECLLSYNYIPWHVIN